MQFVSFVLIRFNLFHSNYSDSISFILIIRIQFVSFKSFGKTEYSNWIPTIRMKRILSEWPNLVPSIFIMWKIFPHVPLSWLRFIPVHVPSAKIDSSLNWLSKSDSLSQYWTRTPRFLRKNTEILHFVRPPHEVPVISMILAPISPYVSNPV